MKNFGMVYGNTLLQIEELSLVGKGWSKRVFKMNDFYVLKIYDSVDPLLRSKEELNQWYAERQKHYKLCPIIEPEELIGYYTRNSFYNIKYYPITKQRMAQHKYKFYACNLDLPSGWILYEQSKILMENLLIQDLHNDNLGLIDDKLKIIDYDYKYL